MVTGKEVAKLAGVAESTVSMVLNDIKSSNVSEKTRARIFEIARKLDYHPHSIGRSLSTGRTFNIAFVLYDIEYLGDIYPGEYFGRILSGINEEVGLNDYNLQFAVTSQRSPACKNLYIFKKIAEGRMDGFLILDQAVSDGDIRKLKNKGVPFVLIDRYIPDKDIYCVFTHLEYGIEEIVKYLFKLGHRKMALVITELSFECNRRAINGYRAGLKKCGLKYNNIAESRNFSDLKSQIQKLVHSPNSPTAFITSEDTTALWVINILNEFGIRVPQDISVTGTNDEDFTSFVNPQITTLSVGLRKIGKIAADILFKLIANKKVKSTKISLKPKIIIRGSSGRTKD